MKISENNRWLYLQMINRVMLIQDGHHGSLLLAEIMSSYWVRFYLRVFLNTYSKHLQITQKKSLFKSLALNFRVSTIPNDWLSWLGVFVAECYLHHTFISLFLLKMVLQEQGTNLNKKPRFKAGILMLLPFFFY